MNPITKHITALFGLSEQNAGIFLSQFTRTELKKNDLFMAEGQVCNKVGLIEQGLMKCVFNKDGEEVVFEFAHEYNFISDYYSFVTNTPSEKEIRCLEDTTVHVITREKLQQLAAERGCGHLWIRLRNLGRLCFERNSRRVIGFWSH